MPGSHKRRRKAAVSAVPLPALAAVILLGGGIVLGTVLALRSEPAASECTEKFTLTVAAAPRLADPLASLAQNTREHPLLVAGRCVTVTVTSRTSADIATQIAQWGEAPGTPAPDATGTARPDTDRAAAGTPATGAPAAEDSTAADEPFPDVWVPESTAWPGIARSTETGARLLPATSEIIATSPVVIAMPRPMAEALGWPHGQFDWQALHTAEGDPGYWAGRGHGEWGPFRVVFADPHTSSASLLSLISLVAEAQDIRPHELTAEQFSSDLSTKGVLLALERRSALITRSTEELLAVLHGADERAETMNRVSAMPLYESDVVAYNRGLLDRLTEPGAAGRTAAPETGGSGGSGTGETGEEPRGPTVPLAAFYPANSSTILDEVPYVVLSPTASVEARAQAAQAFLAMVRSEEGVRLLTAAGLRDTEGINRLLDERLGVLATLPEWTSRPVSPRVLTAARQTFLALHQHGATLAVFDSSGSMAEIVPNSGGRTKFEVAIDAAIAGLPLFADDSELGLWHFSTRLDGDRDYQELVPLGPLSEDVNGVPRREYLTSFAGRIRPANDTGLYDTALAAYEKMTAEYVPGKVNQVVILTDGKNEDPGSISLEELVERLRELYDPQRPVQLITIAYGADADQEALRRISEATGAKSYQSLDPNNIFQVMVHALTDR